MDTHSTIKQSDEIRDYVFPIATVHSGGEKPSFSKFLGTGFLIGNRGFGMTAAHVAHNFQNEVVVAMFASDSGWLVVPITHSEMHAREDVAIFKVAGDSWKSFFRFSNTWEGGACKYRMFGYPEDAAYEIVFDDKVQPRPDLVYAEGYIRRRTNHEIPSMIGRSFFELSEVAGRGCSGSPVFKFTKPVWEVIGIYVGEKIDDRATSVAYAVREESFREWTPKILGTSVLAESQNVSI
jgi:hypothetical protein